MYKFFFISTLLYLILFIIRMLFFIGVSLYNNEKVDRLISLNYRQIISEVIIFTLLFGLSLSVITNYTGSKTLRIGLSTLVIAMVPSFNFIVIPLFHFLFKPKSFKSAKIYKFLKENNLDYNVRVIKGNVINAFATGVLPFSKTILIGEKLVNELEDNQLFGIVMHEVGHLKKNHLTKLYFINLLLSFLIYPLFYIKNHYTFLLSSSMIIEGLEVFCLGLFIGLLFWYIPGKIQSYFELEADTYASKHIGVNEYISSLNRLDDISNGKVTKGGITHPTLIKRINNINKNKNEI